MSFLVTVPEYKLMTFPIVIEIIGIGVPKNMSPLHNGVDSINRFQLDLNRGPSGWLEQLTTKPNYGPYLLVASLQFLYNDRRTDRQINMQMYR